MKNNKVLSHILGKCNPAKAGILMPEFVKINKSTGQLTTEQRRELFKQSAINATKERLQ